MAGNMKGQGGIKGLFLLHGEKIAISLVGVLALWMIYKATSLPRLKEEFQASKLRDQITETSSAVSRTTWPESTDPAFAEVRPAKQLSEKADAAVPVDPYKTASGLDNLIVKQTVLRSDPLLLNAVDVHVTGGSGLFAIIDEAVRKRRDLARAQEDAEKAKKDADRQEKEKKANEGGEAGAGRRNNRNNEGKGEGVVEPIDPNHPKRRPLEGSMQAMGVPLQGGERIEQAYWAIVTAKVPIREQLKLYQDAFEKAKGGFDPARDFPRYKGYLVQRAEVVAGKDLDWKPVPLYDGQRKSIAARTPISANGVDQAKMEQLYAKAAEWAGMSPDVIDPRFSEYILTSPLPPLVGRNWGAEAKHPDFPMLAETPPLEEEIAPLPTTTPGQNPAAPVDEGATFSAGGPAGSAPGAGQFPGSGVGAGMGRGGELGMMGRGSMRGPEGGMGRPMMGRGGPEGGPRGGGGGFTGGMAGAGRTSLPKGVDYLLLRFFDFSVEPGKKYKYRVTLVMADPNFGALPNTLAADVLDRQAKEAAAARARNAQRSDIRRIEKWSDPSPTVGIPLAGGVKLVDIKASADEKINDEPTTTLIVESFSVDDAGDAIQASVKKKEPFRRGSVANLTEDANYAGPDFKDIQKGVKFVTGMTVLDMDGGKQLTKDYKTPGRLLLMGPSGELYIRSESDDKPAVQYHDMLFENERKGPALEGGLEGGPGSRGRGSRGGGR